MNQVLWTACSLVTRIAGTSILPGLTIVILAHPLPPLRLRPRWHAIAQHVLQRPDMVGQSLQANLDTSPNAAMLNRVLESAAQLAGHDYLVMAISDFDGADDDTRRCLMQLAQHNDVLGVPSLSAVSGIRLPQSPYAACSLQAARCYSLAALTAVPAVCWLPARLSGWGAGAAGEWRSGARGGRGRKGGQGHGTGGHTRPEEKAV